MADDEGVVAIPISFLQFLAVRCPYPCKPGDPGTEIPPKCNGVMYFLPERNHKNEQQDFVKLSGFMHNWCMCVCVVYHLNKRCLDGNASAKAKRLFGQLIR